MLNCNLKKNNIKLDAILKNPFLFVGYKIQIICLAYEGSVKVSW